MPFDASVQSYIANYVSSSLPPPFTSDYVTYYGAGMAPDSTVVIYKNKVKVDTTTVAADGTWAYTFATAPSAGDGVSYSGTPESLAATVPTPATPPSTSATTWTLNRLVEWAVGNTSISANAMSYATVTVGALTLYKDTFIARGQATPLSSLLGWNFKTPRVFAVGGTTLAQGRAMYNGTSTTAPCTARWGSIVSGGYVPDFMAFEGGSNDIAGGRTDVQVEADTTTNLSYLRSVAPNLRVQCMAILPRDNFNHHDTGGDDTVMQGYRTSSNAWIMQTNSRDPLSYAWDPSSQVENPASPGHFLPSMTHDGAHPNTPASFRIANYQKSQMQAQGLIPVPIIHPYPLDNPQGVACDPTNLLNFAGTNATTADAGSSIQLMNQSGGAATNMAAGSVAPFGMTVSTTDSTSWTASAGVQPSSSVVADGSCVNRKKIVIAIPNGNAPGAQATAVADVSKTWINWTTGTVIPAARAANFNGGADPIIPGNAYRAGITLTVNTDNFILGGFYLKWAVDGTSLQQSCFVPLGSYDFSDVWPRGTYDLLTPEILIPNFASSIQITNISMILAFTPGLPTNGGTVEISRPYVRKHTFLLSWPQAA